jgi:MFS family permease
MFLSYATLSPILVLYTPDYTCKSDLTIPLNVNRHNETLSSCFADTDDTVKCHSGWTYNTTNLFTTAVTDMDWVCEDGWRAPFTQTMYFVGSFFGCGIFGFISDYIGRFKTFFITNVLLMISGFALPYCYTFETFSTVRFVMGLTFNTFWSSMYVLCIEYVSVDKRSVIGNLGLGFGFTMGGGMVVGLLKFIGDWRIVHKILFLQVGIIFATPFFMKESVRWLVAKGEVAKSVEILRDIAKTNGKCVCDKVYLGFKNFAEEQQRKATKEDKATILSLFKTPRLRKHVILITISWMLTYTIFDGHARNIVNLDYNIIISFTVSALLEFPAGLLPIPLLETIGRRWCGGCSLFLSAISMVVCAVFLENTHVLFVSAMVGRFLTAFAFNTNFQLASELLPTQLRGQGRIPPNFPTNLNK